MVLETNPSVKKTICILIVRKEARLFILTAANSSFPISSSRFKTNIYSFLVTCTHILPLPSLHFRKALTYFLASCLGLTLILPPLYIKTKNYNLEIGNRYSIKTIKYSLKKRKTSHYSRHRKMIEQNKHVFTVFSLYSHRKQVAK